MTMDVKQPSLPTDDDTGEIEGVAVYVYGIGFFIALFIIIIVFYVYYIYKRHICSQAPPPATNVIHENHQLISMFSRGLNDCVLVTYPTFVYSEFMMPEKQEEEGVRSSSCYICLTEYKPVDIIRLLPDCHHLFHVTCIDTWLKAHPTCPVCRKLLLVDIDVPVWIEWIQFNFNFYLYC